MSDLLTNNRWRHLAIALAHDAAGDVVPEELTAYPAAVLLLLYDKDGEPHVLLTRRTDNVAAHKSEISLPGGAYEEDRDPSLLHTALREASEEVGLTPSSLQVIGRLPSIITISSNYMITPYVAVANANPQFDPDPFEVAEVLEVPLAVLRDPALFQEEDWEVDGELQRVAFYRHGENKIWGATARILGEFLALLATTE